MRKRALSGHQKKIGVVCLVSMVCLMLWGKGGLEVDDLVFDLGDGFGNMTGKSQPPAVTLTTLHRIDAAYCNPQRIGPRKNEVMKITYKGAMEEDVATNILDSKGQFVRPYPIEGSESNELALHGTDLPADNPECQYLTSHEDYNYHNSVLWSTPNR